MERSEHTHRGRRFVCGQPSDTALQVSGVAISLHSIKTEQTSLQSSWIAFFPSISSSHALLAHAHKAHVLQPS